MNNTIGPVTAQIDQQQLAKDLVAAAHAEGVELVGLLRLLVALSDRVGYVGGWQLGLECRGLRGVVSERHRRGTRNDLIARVHVLDDDQYRESTRVDTREVAEHPSTALGRLLRPLLRDLGREDLLGRG